jgi:Carbohydrate-binding module family 5/12
VFVTSNAGASWGSAVTGNLQTGLHAGVLYSVEFVRGTPDNLLLVGADRGLFATSADAPGTWQEVGTTLPNAPVFDLTHNRIDDVVAVALFGRSTWTANALAANKAPASLCRDVVVNPAPANCQVTISSSQVNNGSSDPNGDTFSCALSPSTGPFGLGSTPVALVCTDSKGAFSSCAANVQVGPAVPAWNGATAYRAGDRVLFQSLTFMARQPNTGVMPTLPNASPPDTTLASWEIATPCGLSAWLDETHYQVGSMVMFQGTKYVCITDHVAALNWTPNVTGSLWRVATGSDQPTCPCP